MKQYNGMFRNDELDKKEGKKDIPKYNPSRVRQLMDILLRSNLSKEVLAISHATEMKIDEIYSMAPQVGRLEPFSDVLLQNKRDAYETFYNALVSKFSGNNPDEAEAWENFYNLLLNEKEKIVYTKDKFHSGPALNMLQDYIDDKALTRYALELLNKKGGELLVRVLIKMRNFIDFDIKDLNFPDRIGIDRFMATVDYLERDCKIKDVSCVLYAKLTGMRNMADFRKVVAELAKDKENS